MRIYLNDVKISIWKTHITPAPLRNPAFQYFTCQDWYTSPASAYIWISGMRSGTIRNNQYGLRRRTCRIFVRSEVFWQKIPAITIKPPPCNFTVIKGEDTPESSCSWHSGDTYISFFVPELCLLSLLSVTESGLSPWVEHYLTRYAFFPPAQGLFLRENEALTSELQKLLSSLPPASPLSVFNLAEWLSGIAWLREDDMVLFSGQSELFELAGNPDRQRELSETLFDQLE